MKSTIPSKKVEKASEALKKYLDANPKKDLLEEGTGEPIFLVVTNKKFYSSEKSLKPKRVSIPHAIYSDDWTSVCLFSKDPQRAYKNALQGPECKSRKLISRVVGTSKLSGKFRQFEARRQLRNSYDVFVVEDNVFDMVPALLGKSFYKSSKIPLVIKTLDSKGKISDDLVSKQVEEILHSTWFCLPTSVTLSIKIGYSSFSPKQLAENVEAVAQFVNEQVFDGQWKKEVKSAYIKSEFSPSLPVYLADQIYNEEDVIQASDVTVTAENDKEAMKRKRGTVDVLEEEDPNLLLLKDALAEVVDEEELAEFYEKQAKRAKKGKKEKKGEKDEKKESEEKKDEDNEQEAKDEIEDNDHEEQDAQNDQTEQKETMKEKVREIKKDINKPKKTKSKSK